MERPQFWENTHGVAHLSRWHFIDAFTQKKKKKYHNVLFGVQQCWMALNCTLEKKGKHWTLTYGEESDLFFFIQILENHCLITEGWWDRFFKCLIESGLDIVVDVIKTFYGVTAWIRLNGLVSIYWLIMKSFVVVLKLV